MEDNFPSFTDITDYLPQISAHEPAQEDRAVIKSLHAPPIHLFILSLADLSVYHNQPVIHNQDLKPVEDKLILN